MFAVRICRSFITSSFVHMLDFLLLCSSVHPFFFVQSLTCAFFFILLFFFVPLSSLLICSFLSPRNCITFPHFGAHKIEAKTFKLCLELAICFIVVFFAQ